MRTLFPETMVVAAADRAACRALLASGSRSFHAASHFLPQRVRDPATALYAFCRLADDAVDLEAAAGRAATIVRLEERLDRAYRGAPLPYAADRAFADTVHRHEIPREFPAALLEGLAWDAEGRTYETLEALHAYAARVAGAVGAMMTLVMGVRDPTALARACDLGAAMQLTNIARDVGEDARAGRLYLPLSWMADAGLDAQAFLAAPRFTPALGSVVERLLAEADRLYRLGETGIAALPADCRRGIRAARLLYAEIGAEVARRGFDSVAGRARVSSRRKLMLAGAAIRPRWTRDVAAAPALAPARFLVDAVVPRPAQKRPAFAEQVMWALDLFERVDRRRLEGRA